MLFILYKIKNNNYINKKHNKYNLLYLNFYIF